MLLYHLGLAAYDGTVAAKTPAPDTEEPSEIAAEREKQAIGEARQIFIRCIEKFPLSPVVDHAAHHLILLDMREEKWQTVVDFATHFMSVYPESRVHPVALYHQGLAAIRMERNGEAEGYFRKMLALYPDDPYAEHAAAELLRIVNGDRLLEEAEDLVTGGNFAGAGPILEALFRLGPEEGRARSGFLWACSQFYQNRWDKAGSIFEEWLRIHPSHDYSAEAWYMLSQCHVARGRFEDALASLRNATAIMPAWEREEPYSALLKSLLDSARGEYRTIR